MLCVSQAQYLRSQGDSIGFVTLAYDPARWGSQLQGVPVRVAAKVHWTDLFHSPSRVERLTRRGRRAAALMRDFDVVVAHNFPCGPMLGAAQLPSRKVWQCNEPPRGIHLRLANPALTARADAAPAQVEDASTPHWRQELMLGEQRSVVAAREWDLQNVARLDQIYAISEFSRDNARRIYGRCAQEVVYPMVRFPVGGRSRLGLDRAGLGVLVHSRLELTKNVDTVIRGFAGFAGFGKSHTGAHLHVVGEGHARAELEGVAARLLPPGAFTFHGYLSAADLARVYDRCDVFALLPLDEPFGMVFPEAAAKGLLLIGPDHGGPLEILDGGKHGWCIDAFEPAALTDALEQITVLTDAEVDRRRSEADRACRARFSEHVVGPSLRRMVLAG